MEPFFQTPGYFGSGCDEFLCGLILVALILTIVIVLYWQRF